MRNARLIGEMEKVSDMARWCRAYFGMLSSVTRYVSKSTEPREAIIRHLEEAHDGIERIISDLRNKK